MAKSAVKSVFSLHSLPVIFTPRPPFFARSSHFWDKIHLLRGVFLFRSREILARNLCLRRKNQFDEVLLFGVRPNFDFCRRGKGGSRRFSPNKRRSNIKMGKGGAEIRKSRRKSKRTSWKNKKRRTKKAQGHHGKDQAQASKRNCFSSPPPLHSKNTSRLSLKTSPLFATSSLVSLKTSPPRTKSLSPYAQDTRLRVYTRPRSQRICHFCLRPSPHPATNCVSTN